MRPNHPRMRFKSDCPIEPNKEESGTHQVGLEAPLVSPPTLAQKYTLSSMHWFKGIARDYLYNTPVVSLGQ